MAQRPGGAQGMPSGGMILAIRARRSAAVHAGKQPSVPQAAVLEGGSLLALLDGQAGRRQEPMAQNAGLGDMKRLPELHAGRDEIGGIGDVELVLARRSRRASCAPAPAHRG